MPSRLPRWGRSGPNQAGAPSVAALGTRTIASSIVGVAEAAGTVTSGTTETLDSASELRSLAEELTAEAASFRF